MLVLKMSVIYSQQSFKDTVSIQSEYDSLIEELNKNQVDNSANDKAYDEAIKFFTRIDTSSLLDQYDHLDLFEIIDTLVSLSQSDTNYIRLVFDLDKIVKTNAELCEYISENIHRIALHNTEGFLRVFENVDSEQKDQIKGNLFWLIENEKLDEFADQLTLITEKDLFNVIAEIKNYLELD